MTDIFLYGTLRHLPLLGVVLDRDPAALDTTPASLPDHATRWAEGQAFPMVVAEPGASAPGLLLRGLDATALDRLTFYEAIFGYPLHDVTVTTMNGTHVARVFLPPDTGLTPGAPFDLQDWAESWGDISLSAAGDAMARFGRVAPEDLAPVMPFLRARGWSHALARDTAPQTLRSTMTLADVQLHDRPRRYDGFFRMEGLDLSHRRFDGGWSPRVRREGFVAFDAALVLPYDPKNDLVLVIEQMRYGPLLRHDAAPWVLEPIAGLIDAGESPADSARREAEEEAGITLGDLIPMTRVYASPGYSSEFFHCFLGLCDLSNFHTGIGGLDEENEDIRSHVLPLSRAMELIATGEINAAPLAMMLLWVQAHRDRLRATA